ncbi:cache domain-containing protein, partial [uncultured Amnibacterium sp.]|uniref:cache domain-containing protein n=1 Tax=uncultured Amnibacterium sp. TaxID=1631851 RepID=UPI0035CA0FC4
RGPEAAANAAGAASQIELEALLRLRLTALTPTRDVRRGDGLDDPRTIATAAQSHVDEIMSRLTMFAESAGHEMTAIIRDEHGLDEGLLALDRASFDAISAMPRTVHGCGVLFRAGVLPENRLAGAWFVREASQILRHPHEFDETQPDFYDYSRAAWMSETPIVVGPYVDSGGVDDYVLTLAVPVLTAAGFIGVAAADMPVEQFELEFAPQLLTAGPMSLVNREGRVIVSTVPAVTPGTLLRSGPETDSFAVGTFGWRVITTHG